MGWVVAAFVAERRTAWGVLVKVGTRDGGSGEADEAVQHALLPRMLELDLEFIAFDYRDRSVAEFAVEDALAEGEVVAAFVAEGDGAGAGFEGGALVVEARPHPSAAVAAPSLSRRERV